MLLFRAIHARVMYWLGEYNAQHGSNYEIATRVDGDYAPLPVIKINEIECHEEIGRWVFPIFTIRFGDTLQFGGVANRKDELSREMDYSDPRLYEVLSASLEEAMAMPREVLFSDAFGPSPLQSAWAKECLARWSSTDAGRRLF